MNEKEAEQKIEDEHRLTVDWFIATKHELSIEVFLAIIDKKIELLLTDEEKEKIDLYLQIKVLTERVTPAKIVNFKELQERRQKLEEEIKQIIKRLENS